MVWSAVTPTLKYTDIGSPLPIERATLKSITLVATAVAVNACASDSFKKASETIIQLQNKNASLKMQNNDLRVALTKLVEICDNTNQKDVSEIWWFRIGLAKEALTIPPV